MDTPDRIYRKKEGESWEIVKMSSLKKGDVFKVDDVEGEEFIALEDPKTDENGKLVIFSYLKSC